MKQPVIYFEHYMLRDIELKDGKDMYEYGKDLETVQYLSWGPYADISESYAAIKQFFLTRPSRGLPIGYAIVDLRADKMIGTIDFHTIVSPGVVEIGYCLNKKYWNQGIVTKALKKLIDVCFYYHGFDKLIIGHANANAASKRVIEKAGFVFDYEDSEKYYNRFTGQHEPSSWYYMTKELKK